MIKRNNGQGKQPQDGPPKGPQKFNPLWWVYLLVLGLVLGPYLFDGVFRAKKVSWTEFTQELLPSGDIERIVVKNKEIAEIYLKESAINETDYPEVTKDQAGPAFELQIGSIETFESKLEEAQKDVPAKERIDVQYETESNWFWNLLGWILPFVVLIFLWLWILRRAGGGMGGIGGKGMPNPMDFGKISSSSLEEGGRSKVNFKDVAGMEEAKEEIREIVDFLKRPEKFTRLGAKIPKGVLLVGPPGTGKTLLAKAVAGEAKVPFFSMSGSEFVEMFVGVGASRVRDLFKQAKKKAPSIIFIDEIDAVGRSRSRTFSMSSNDERESTLNQLLTEMDGFDNTTGVIVLGATNRADMLDRALLRPGRFDRHIYLEMPNKAERKAIFEVHLRPLKLADDVDPAILSAQTPGFSGADIANICNEAALIAARREKEAVHMADFLDATDRVIAGLEKKSKIISKEERKIIAFHEAGHATVSWFLPHADTLFKVSIVPRGKSLGAAWYLPQEHQLHTREQFLDRLCAALGGRASEDITFGRVSSGALDDLEKVTKQAYTMVAYYGLDEKIGNISYYDSTGEYRESFQKPYSEATAQLIDQQVRAMVSTAYERTKELLTEHRDELEQLAELLLEKEVVFKEDLEKIMGKRHEAISPEEES